MQPNRSTSNRGPSSTAPSSVARSRSASTAARNGPVLANDRKASPPQPSHAILYGNDGALNLDGPESSRYGTALGRSRSTDGSYNSSDETHTSSPYNRSPPGSDSSNGLLASAHPPARSLPLYTTPPSQLHGPQMHERLAARPAVAPLAFSGVKGEKWVPEADDKIHNPGKKLQRVGPSRMIIESSSFRGHSFISWRGILNGGSLILIVLVIIGTFGGYPIAMHLTDDSYVNTSSYLVITDGTSIISGLGAVINADAPPISSFSLIDVDTPDAAKKKIGVNGQELQLVFSDEFNTPGRTFYPGEDPIWTAVDLRYWQTGDVEWYDPGQAFTKDGSLQFSLTKETLENSHQTGFLGAMVQSWNSLCFTGGYIEVAASLPGDTKVSGAWPACWLMANIGRAGYGASLDGTWPYSYDTCDVGTLANQTLNGAPAIATTSGPGEVDGSLSYLPGQKLSRCTCPGEDHPGPVFKNGSFPGRSAAEIDVFEASAGKKGGQVSQSAQFAPFDASYKIVNDSSAMQFYDTRFDTVYNPYLGGQYQQAVSGLSKTDPSTYDSSTTFSIFGVDYEPSHINNNGSITWINQNEVILSDKALAPNPATEIGQRVITGEPMSIVMNLGMSESFADIDVAKLAFPLTMRIDYVRIYQPPDAINVGCDPKDFPTMSYIEDHLEAYMNVNLTTWADYKNSVFPKNSLIDTC